MSRFKLEPSTQQQGWWVLTDKENGIVCRFKEHQFNETQKMAFLEDVEQPDALTIARFMREMADWLRKNHYDKIF